MADFKPYKVNSLPTSNIDVNGIYYVKTGNTFKAYIRNQADTDWVKSGADVDVIGSKASPHSTAIQIDTENATLGYRIVVTYLGETFPDIDSLNGVDSLEINSLSYNFTPNQATRIDLTCVDVIANEYDMRVYTIESHTGFDFYSNMVAYWKLERNSLDYSANGLNGIDQDVLYDGDKVYFGPGTERRCIDIPDTDDLSFTDGMNDLKASFFIPFILDDKTGTQFLLSKRGESDNREFHIYSEGTNLNFTIYGVSSSVRLNVDLSLISLGVLNTLYFEYDGSKAKEGLRAILNGSTLVGTTEEVGVYTGQVNGTSKATIGANSFATQGYKFKGKMKHLAIWKGRNLTDEEVAELDRRVRNGIDFISDKMNFPPSTTVTSSSYMAGLRATLTNAAKSQGGALFGTYLFVGSGKGKYIDVYDLVSKTRVNEINITGATETDNNHMNTMFFSEEKYDPSDVFPLLYSSSGYSVEVSTGINGEYLYGYRITESGGVFSAELVHTIKIQNKSWTEPVLDIANNHLWLKHGIIGGIVHKKYAMPSYASGNATIDVEVDVPLDEFTTVERDYGWSSGQGRFFYDNKILTPSGTGSEIGGERIIVTDLIQKKDTQIVDLRASGMTGEPEYIIRYDNKFMIGHRTELFEFQFNTPL